MFYIFSSLFPSGMYSPFGATTQPTNANPTTGPTQPTTINPTTGPTQPTTIGPTIGPPQPTTTDLMNGANQLRNVLGATEYGDFINLFSYNDHVENELCMNKSFISVQENDSIKSKPTRSEKTEDFLEHVQGKLDNLNWLMELATVLESDPGDQHNQKAGQMLMAAIDKVTELHCKGTCLLAYCRMCVS